jgi:DNA-binding MurR/RpiR family transcriptional regulator
MKTLKQTDGKPSAGFQFDIQKLSRKRRETIRPALEKPQDFVLLSARVLGERLGIDAATVVRIAQTLGFESYRDFQRYLHSVAIARATSLDAMKASAHSRGSIANLIRDSLDRDLMNLNNLRHSLDYKGLATVVPKLYRASRILIFAGDLASTLAAYLEHQLTILDLPVVSVTSWGRISHIARNAGKKDVVIAISFRKGLRQTVEGLQLAHDNGAYCIGITDTHVSPVAQSCDHAFLVSIEAPPFGASYIAPMALFNSLLVACANYRRSRTLALLRAADKEERYGSRWYQM